MIDPRAQELYRALACLVGALTAPRGEFEETHGFTSRCTPELIAAAAAALAAAERAGYSAPDDGAFTRAAAEALVGQRIMTTRRTRRHRRHGDLRRAPRQQRRLQRRDHVGAAAPAPAADRLGCP